MSGSFRMLIGIFLALSFCAGAYDQVAASDQKQIVIAQNAPKPAKDRSSGKGPSCPPNRGIWGVGDAKLRSVVYGSNGITYPSDIYFEEWRNNKLAWRVKGFLSCSNGVSTCYAQVESNGKRNSSNGDAPPTSSSVLELIDENGDGLADFVIFAGLAQELYHDGGAKVTWFNGFAPQENERPALPENIYKFMACRATNDLELLDAPRSLIGNSSTTPFGQSSAWEPLNLPTRQCLPNGAYSKACAVGPFFIDAPPESEEVAELYGGERIPKAELETAFNRFVSALENLKPQGNGEPLGYFVFGPLDKENTRGIRMIGGVIDASGRRLVGTEVVETIASTSDPKQDDIRERTEQFRLKMQRDIPACPSGVFVGCNLAKMSAQQIEAAYFEGLGLNQAAVLKTEDGKLLGSILGDALRSAAMASEAKLTITLEDLEPDLAKIKGYKRRLMINVFNEVDGDLQLQRSWALRGHEPA